MATKFIRSYIQPNPLETHYWIDLSENQFGGVIKYYNSNDWVKLNNGGNDLSQIMPLTIKDSYGNIKVIFDGTDPKELVLTKELIGLSNVDNTADIDKNVKYANSAEYSYGLKRRQDDKLYVTYGFIGSDPYSSIGNTDEEIWIQGSSIWLRGDAVVSGSLTVNGGISLNKLIVKNYNLEEILTFDGNGEKTLTLTKDLVGLNNVDNTKDSDKRVNYAQISGQSYKLVNSITLKDHENVELLKFNGQYPESLRLTKDIIGLENVDNTADADKTVKHSDTSNTSYKLINGKGSAIAGSLTAGTVYTNYLGNLTDDTWFQGKDLLFITGAGGTLGEHQLHIYNDGNTTLDVALRIGEGEGAGLPRATLDVFGEIWTTEGIQINGTKLSKQESGALEVSNDLIVTDDTLKISIVALYNKVLELEQEIAKLKS